MARRVLGAADEAGRIELAFGSVVSRGPTADERAAAAEFLATQGREYDGKPQADENVWTDFCQMLFASNAFLYVD